MGLGPESAVRRTVTPYACALAITIRLAHALLPVIWCSTATSRWSSATGWWSKPGVN